MKTIIILFISLFANNLSACLILIDQQDFSKAGKVKFAQKIYDRFYEIDNAIPTLSPDQLKWLSTELNSGNSKRLGSAVNGKEYMQRRAKLELKYIVDVSKSIATKKHNNETIAWTALSSNMLNTTLYAHLITLQKSGHVNVPNMKDNVKWDGFMSGKCVSVAQDILRKIVIPNMRGK